MSWRETSLSTISLVFIPKHFPGQSLVGVGEEMRFRPRAVVVGKELMSGCTRIASREYVHDK